MLIFCALTGMLVLSATPVLAQEISTVTITKQLTDQNADPVAGAAVKAFYSGSVAYTDNEGNFTIDVVSVEDKLVVQLDGYHMKVVDIDPQNPTDEPVVIKRKTIIDPENEVELPYGSFNSARNVSSVYTITGEELESYPTGALMEALSGRVPGLAIHQSTSFPLPGEQAIYATLRGQAVTFYIDGIVRDVSGLSPSEVQEVQVFKDLSSRASLGITGSGPVIWITTKKGRSFNKEIGVSAEYGLNMPTVLPDYVNSYQYATLFNEAWLNDGNSTPYYDQTALDAYQTGSNTARYPDVNYYDKYVSNYSPFRKANLHFAGGDDNVNYFSMLDYFGNNGLEAVGEDISNDRFKARGNINVRLNDFMKLSVNIAGSFQTQRYPNNGGGAGAYNMFNILSRYPSNAHPIRYNDSLIISDDYPVNLDNELMYSGYAEANSVNTQNDARLMIDLGSILEGLSFAATASFDVSYDVTASKGGTAALFRINYGDDPYTLTRIVEEVIDPTLGRGSDYILRRTAGYATFKYDRVFGEKHAITANATFFQGLEEAKLASSNYQPEKRQDLTFRANYAFDNRYIIQADLAYSGSMRMPEGERYSLYPTIGAAWVASNEPFLRGNSLINYLKLHSSFGIMGVSNFSLLGYNTYYLHETLWEEGSWWASGISGQQSSGYYAYNIQQAGSDDYVLPKKRYFNLGLQSSMLNNRLSFEVSYFNEKNYDKISQMQSYIPAIFGTGAFLPAANFEEDMRWGIDGMIQYTILAGDFTFTAGVNGLYMRGKNLVVDEPIALEEYRKRAGKDSDLYWLYEDDGLFQSAADADAANQSWGSVQEGDIKYVDYNNDGVIDEKDIHSGDYHAPRIYYGLNFSVAYKGLRLYVLGQGRADGDIQLSSGRYFKINGQNQNYSTLMLDRYPVTNDYPRLTTSSQNNMQNSTYWMRNAAFLRLKNVELSYTLPAAVSRQLLMSNFRLFVRGTNLLTLSELTEYSVDPENMNAGISDYPIFKTFTFGLSCKF